MIGLYSTLNDLNHLRYRFQFTISCDMPFIKPEVIQYMNQFYSNYDYIIPQWNNGYIEPLFAIYPIKITLNLVKKCLKTNQLKLTNIIDINSKVRYISIENELKKYDSFLETFININNKNDIPENKKKRLKF